MKYGNPDEVREAEEMVNNLQGNTLARVGKQKVGGGIRQGGWLAQRALGSILS